MKYVLIVISVFIFVSCSADSESSNLITYWKDERTGICYASMSYPGFQNYSFTYVPCDSIPKELLK